VLRYRFHWQRVSAAGFLCYRADGQRARLYLHTQPGSYTTDILIPALRQLRRSLRAPVILIWDGLTCHWSRKMSAFVASQKWLQVERLPGYAPDLNPCEGLWANLKGGELANRAEDTIAEVNRVARRAAKRAASSQQLLFGFLAQTGLSF
jgi:transposase